MVDWKYYVDNNYPIKRITAETGLYRNKCYAELKKHGWKPTGNVKVKGRSNRNDLNKTCMTSYLRGGKPLDVVKKNRGVKPEFVR